MQTWQTDCLNSASPKPLIMQNYMSKQIKFSTVFQEKYNFTDKFKFLIARIFNFTIFNLCF